MNYNKSTRYALHAAVEMALADDPVTVGSLASKYSIPEGALAKVLQLLVRARIARGVRGVGGGYVLTRQPSEITVLDVISVFEPPRPAGQCLLNDDPSSTCEPEPSCQLRRLFDEVDEMARCTFASVTIETLVRDARA